MYRHVAICLCLTSTLSVGAPSATADSNGSLAGAVSSARAASSCAPLRPDPVVERAATMANQQTSDYFSHRTAAVPFTDPMPALKTIGYPGTKAMLLSGYGSTLAEAIKSLLLQWSTRKPDCSWSQIGISTLSDDAGLNLASAILAAP